ncbi:hypothetical protein LLG95_10360 [bacterium]|nr:hypothetical protein [bacterium]
MRRNATTWIIAAAVVFSSLIAAPARAQDSAMPEVIYESNSSEIQTAAAAEMPATGVLGAARSKLTPEQIAMMKAARDKMTSSTVARVRARAKMPDAKPKIDDMETTMLLNLQGMQIDQLVKFLAETTKRPVIKGPGVDAKVDLMSPVPVTKKKALQEIYRSLQMQNVFVIDDGERLTILKGDDIKKMPMRAISADEDLQSIPESPQLAQKVYRLKNIGADSLQKQLERVIPKESLTVDQQSNTIMVMDQINRLKQYDQIIRVLDQAQKEDRVTDIYVLENSDAMEMATLILNVLAQTPGGAPPSRGGSGGEGGGGMSPDMMMMSGMYGGRSSRMGGSSSSAPAPKSASATAGEVTIVSDPRMNWLIIVAPQRRIAEVRELIKKFDVARDQDVRTRAIPVKHVEIDTLINAAKQLIADRTMNRTEREQVRIVGADDGNSILVMSSEANFKLVQDLANQLDTDTAGKKEMRTYKIKNLEATSLAQQLQQLFDDNSSTGRRYYYYWGGDDNSSQAAKPSFSPMPRSNSLMVRARPRDFDFIEKMILELDKPATEGQYEPRIFQIRNTDANEVLDVLKTIFGEGPKQRQSYDEMWMEYYWGGSSSKKGDAIDAQFGKTRFVVDNVTNRIIALSSNPSNYAIIARIIEQLDTFDKESAQLMIYELKYADALDVANHINNLLSDGPVQRGGSGTQQRPQGNDNSNRRYYGNDNENDNNTDSDAQLASYFYDGEREVIFPWQSPGRERQRRTEEERPINTMVGNVRIVPDLASNRIMIAAPAIYFNTLKTILSELDVPQPQVHIKVRIVEIMRNDEERIGVRWFPDPGTVTQDELNGALFGLSQLNYVDAFGPHGGAFDFSSGSDAQNLIATTTRKGNVLIGSSVNLNLLVQLLIKNSNGRIVSSPEITVNNNQLGHFSVASFYPFLTNSQSTDVGSITNGYEYKPYGIFLIVRPHINPKGEIVLKAAVENSKVREGVTFNGQLIADSQRLQSEMKINSGETMVIGGIKQDTRQRTDHKVPILGSIPVVNWAFKKKDDVGTQRELVLFLTPEVLKTDEDKAGVLTRQLEQLREIDPFPKEKIMDLPGIPEKKK